MKNMKLAADFVIKHDDRTDFMHSSGYAKAQNRESFGAAGAASFEIRKSLDEQRKYVKNYKSSKIGSVRISEIHPKVYRREEDIIKREDSVTKREIGTKKQGPEASRAPLK